VASTREGGKRGGKKRDKRGERDLLLPHPSVRRPGAFATINKKEEIRKRKKREGKKGKAPNIGSDWRFQNPGNKKEEKARREKNAEGVHFFYPPLSLLISAETEKKGKD